MDPFGYRMSPPFDIPIAIRAARRKHGRAESAAQPAMATNQEENFLLGLPFGKGNQEAAFRIPASLIEGPDELFRYRNEVPVGKRIALSSSLKRQRPDSQVFPKGRRVPTRTSQA